MLAITNRRQLSTEALQRADLSPVILQNSLCTSASAIPLFFSLLLRVEGAVTPSVRHTSTGGRVSCVLSALTATPSRSGLSLVFSRSWGTCQLSPFFTPSSLFRFLSFCSRFQHKRFLPLSLSLYQPWGSGQVWPLPPHANAQLRFFGRKGSPCGYLPQKARLYNEAPRRAALQCMAC